MWYKISFIFLFTTCLSDGLFGQKVWLEMQMGGGVHFYANEGRNELISFDHGPVFQFGAALHYKVNDQWQMTGRVRKVAELVSTYSSIVGSGYLSTPNPLFLSLEAGRNIQHNESVTSGFQAGVSYVQTYGQLAILRVNYFDTTKPVWMESVSDGFRKSLGITGQYALWYRMGKYIAASVFVNANWIFARGPYYQVRTTFINKDTGEQRFQTHTERKLQLALGVGLIMPL